MGTWDVEAFGNDAACDWAQTLVRQCDLSRLWNEFREVLKAGGENIDADDGCRAIAACEVVARLKGNWGTRNSHTKAVDTWVESYGMPPPIDLVLTAIQVLDRIRTPPSELLELWDDDDVSAWSLAIDDLRDRIAR